MSLQAWYPVIKATHVGLALLSGAVFAGRGIGVLMGATAPMARSVRRLSQLIDTALLAAALLLLVILRLNPFAVPWLAAKLALLLAYIVFGILALRRAPTVIGKLVCYLIALLCLATMLSVARTHDPLGWLRLFGAA